MPRKSRQLYEDIAQVADSSLSARRAVANGRGGELKVPRRYHLQASKLIELRNKMKDEGKFLSPYGSNRIYTFIIEALVELGVGKPHATHVVWSKFQEVTSRPETVKDGKTAWQRFSEREQRNATTGLDDFSRFLQNVEVLQRLGGDHPYGFKLAQVGACIDVLVDVERNMKIQLRTGIADGDPVKPVNLNRKRAYTKTVDYVPAGVIINGVVEEAEAEAEAEGAA